MNIKMRHALMNLPCRMTSRSAGRLPKRSERLGPLEASEPRDEERLRVERAFMCAYGPPRAAVTILAGPAAMRGSGASRSQEWEE